MDKIKYGTKVVFQNEVYTVIEDPLDDSLLVKRGGAKTPISIPKKDAEIVFQEGRSLNPQRKLNG